MYIHIKVNTDAKREEIKRISVDHLEISVKEPAKQNLANKKIIAIMQSLYPNSRVKIINGHHSPSKLLSVELKEEKDVS